MKKIRPILIAVLIVMIVKDFVSVPKPDIPVDNPYVKILNLQEPSEKIIELTTPVSVAMGQNAKDEDKELVAIFHNEMAKRLANYKNITTIQFENYYLDSAKEIYGDKIRGKYKDLGNEVQKLVINTLGEDEGVITEQEMNNLATNMKGIAWVLLGK